MSNVLMICNTPYQIFVATWIKFNLLSNDIVDIMISDHMSGAQSIADNTKNAACFDKVYFVKSKQFCKEYMNAKMRYSCMLNGFHLLDKYVKVYKKYDKLYVSNVDKFSQLVYYTIANTKSDLRKNSGLKLYVFEDGVATYSKVFEGYYNSTKLGKKRFFPFYRPKVIYGNIDGFCAFDADCFLWKIPAPVLGLPKVNCENSEFKKVINTIFSYEKSNDVYDKKYIFFEESFLAEGSEIADVEFLENLSARVGKENIMVKVHPRNPINRFKDLGYKTNHEIAIPWEVIALNQDMSDKKLITVSSSAIVNPIRVLGQSVQAYSIYKYFEHMPDLFSEVWKATSRFYEKYYPLIKICDGNDINKI